MVYNAELLRKKLPNFRRILLPLFSVSSNLKKNPTRFVLLDFDNEGNTKLGNFGIFYSVARRHIQKHSNLLFETFILSLLEIQCRLSLYLCTKDQSMFEGPLVCAQYRQQ